MQEIDPNAAPETTKPQAVADKLRKPPIPTFAAGVIPGSSEAKLNRAGLRKLRREQVREMKKSVKAAK